LAGRAQVMFEIECLVEQEADVEFLDVPRAAHLYRIAQEAISNAVKHGNAKNVLISLAREKDAMVLTISDDGRGMPPPPHRSGGMGLRTMRYRARMINATLEVVNPPTGGVAIICRCPVEEQLEGMSHDPVN
jgi:signal transduction histidine kinase